jgi:hypothetical protein
MIKLNVSSWVSDAARNLGWTLVRKHTIFFEVTPDTEANIAVKETACTRENVSENITIGNHKAQHTII